MKTTIKKEEIITIEEIATSLAYNESGYNAQSIHVDFVTTNIDILRTMITRKYHSGTDLGLKANWDNILEMFFEYESNK